MKNKHWRIIILSFLLIGFLIISERLLIKEIVFIYLLVFIPSAILMNIEYLIVRKKTDYSKFLIKKLHFNLAVVFFFLACVIFLTQPKYITKENAKNDLKFMISSLENIHPDIYHVITKDSFSIVLNNEIENLPDKISELQFYKICSRLTSNFRTGHTKPMENLIWLKTFFYRAFPFQTKIIDNKLFVTENLSLFNKIPIGSEIIEVNGKNISTVIDEWSRLVSYENNAFRNYQITKPTKIGIWNDFENYRIKYIDYKNKKVKEKNVSGSIYSNLYRVFKLKYTRPSKLFYRKVTPDIGYIGFFDCHDLENYKQFYKSTFAELKNKGTEHLIIDIRQNRGGHTIIGAELMQYIFHQPFKEIDSAIVKVSNELIATGKVKRKLGDGEKEIGKTYTRIPNPYNPRENPYRFDGMTYLFIDNGTFSAGQGFASSYACYSNGITIGEETGGVTVNFGDVHMFYLPNTNLKIMTSWEQAFSACGVDNQRGIIPDYIVYNSIDDYMHGNDKVLDFTIDLIKKRQKTPHNILGIKAQLGPEKRQ